MKSANSSERNSTKVLEQNDKSKTFLKQRTDAQGQASLEHEWKVLKYLKLNSVPKPLDFRTEAHISSLTMSYIDASSLSEQISRNGPFAIEDALVLMCSIAEVINELHFEQVIHADLSASNVLCTPDLKAYIIDFELSEILDSNDKVSKQEHLQGTMEYLAPERTGKLDTKPDFRSDFYSLGILFYEIITGKVPFTGDINELIYCHIVAEPAAIPADFNCPLSLEKLIQKLLKKDPFERYQTASGLLHDISQCRLMLENTIETPRTGIRRELDSFQLGLEDKIPFFRLSRKTYLTEKPVHNMLEVFEQLGINTPTCIIIEAPRGAGKTEIIQQFLKNLPAGSAIVAYVSVSSIFSIDSLQPLNRAIDEIIEWLVHEKDSRGQSNAKYVHDKFIGNKSILCSFYPRAKMLFGESQDLEEVNLRALPQSRFTVTLDFLQCVSQIRPVVIIIDDFQLLKNPMAELLAGLYVSLPQNTLLIFSGRKARNDQECSLLQLLGQNSSSRFVRIEPNLFSNETIEVLLQDSNLQSNLNSALALIIEQKTEGIPGSVSEILKLCSEKNSIVYNHRARVWDIDLSAIVQIQPSENVLDLLISKLKSLSGLEIELLALLSVSKRELTDRALSQFTNTPLDVVRKGTEKLWYQKYIRRCEKPEARHLQEKIAWAIELQAFGAAAEALFDEHNLVGFHLLCAEKIVECNFEQYFLSQNPLEKNSDIDTTLLEQLASHFDFGLNYLEQYPEKKSEKQFAVLKCKTRIAGCFSLVAARATLKGSFTTALSYYERIHRLDLSAEESSCFYDHQRFCLAFAESLYLNKQFVKSEDLARKALSENVPPVLKSEFSTLLMDMYMMQDSPQKLIAEGERFLLELDSADAKSKIPVSDLGFIELSQKILKEITSEPVSGAYRNTLSFIKMRILSKMVPACFQTNKQKYQEIILEMLYLSNNEGINPYSSYAFINGGLVLSVWHNQPVLGFELAMRGKQMLEAFNTPWLEPTLHFVFGFGVAPWSHHLLSSLQHLKDSARAGRVLGDHIRAHFAITMSIKYMYMAGINLFEVKEKIQKEFSYLEKSPLPVFASVAKILIAKINEYAEGSPYVVSSGLTPEKIIEANTIVSSTGVRYFKVFCSMLEAQQCLIQGDFLAGLDAIKPGMELIESAKGMFTEIEMRFFEAIILGWNAKNNHISKETALEQVEKSIEILESLAKTNEANFAHKLYLVKAVCSVVTGAPSFELFQVSFLSAFHQGFYFDAALSLDLLGQVLIELNIPLVARSTMLESALCYEKWGAFDKANRLKEKAIALAGNSRLPFPLMTLSATNEEHWKTTLSTTVGLRIDQINIASVLKATKAISSGIDLDSMLQRLLEIMFESAAAKHGALVNVQEGLDLNHNTFHLLAFKKGEQVEVISGSPEPLNRENCTRRQISLLALEHVVTTKKNLVFNRSSQSTTADISQSFEPLGIKSAVYLPIFKAQSSSESDTKVQDIAVLQHDQFEGLFSNATVELLGILAAQASVSFGNTRLFLEAQVKLKLEAEISATEVVQSALLPQALKLKQLDLGIAYRSADQTGGDWFNVFESRSGDFLFLFCGDVTGHGVASALVTGVASGAIEASMFSVTSSMEDPDAEKLPEILLDTFDRTNHAILRTGGKVGKAMSMIGCAFDLRNSKLHLVSAGHCLPFLFRDKKRRAIQIFSSNLLGYQGSEKFVLTTTDFCKQDMIFVYTDGLKENEWASCGVLPSRKIAEIAASFSPFAKTCIAKLSDHIGLHSKDQILEDDCSIIAVSWPIQTNSKNTA